MQTNWWTLLGALLFVGGVVVSLISIDKSLILISLFGLFLSLISLYFGYRKKARNRKIETARCVDREWKQVPGRLGLRGGTTKVWTFMLLCEFEIAGQLYSVTPGYRSPTFLTEKQLKKFLNKVITSDIRCRLRVNSENPLQNVTKNTENTMPCAL